MAIETSELFDTEILVGKGPNSKIFRLHSYILKAFSPYFRTALSIKKDNNNNIIKLKKPNISIEIFDIIIKYLYCGKLIATNDYAKYTKLSQFCKDAFQKDPSLIFNSKDFTKIKREILLDILIKNNHNLKSIEIYDKIMEWIITQSNELSSDNIKLFIQQFIPYINFKEIEPTDFLKKIKPLRNIFDDKIYSKILEYYSFNHMNGISKIINFDSLLLLSKIIEIAETNNCSTNTINLYNFKLLIRGSQNGFNYKTFHEFCDNKGPTITIAKIKGVDEFIGGYNPNNWGSSNNWTKKSFIFSLNQNNLINSIISKEIHNDSKKSNYIGSCGPEFGSDLILLLSNNENNNKGRCCRNNYEKRIRNNDETDFEIEEYEVFRVYKNFY
ncbi:unnamed protein product [Rhizophagus irregularis]|nr:unnamed protein product [Rhizophagus irregularis]